MRSLVLVVAILAFVIGGCAGPGTTTSAFIAHTAIAQYLFTNTGNTTWTFGASAFLRRPDGTTLNLVVQPKSLEPGRGTRVSWNYTTDQPGNWDFRVVVWKESSSPFANIVVDTGWLEDFVTVGGAMPHG